MIKALLIFLFFITFTISHKAKAEDESQKNLEKAIKVTTKAIRKIKEVRTLEKKLINIGKDYIEEIPYSEEILGAIAIVTQPLKFKIDKYQHIELNYRRSEISYRFTYDF